MEWEQFRNNYRVWKVSLDFCIQTDYAVEDQAPDLVAVDKKIKIFFLSVPVDSWEENKENKNI